MLAGYHHCWEIRPGFPSSDHSFHVVNTNHQSWIPSEAITSQSQKYTWKLVCQLVLRWLQCGTAMSGPRTAAWQGHGKTRCRGNRCCKDCKAEHHFVHNGELLCAHEQCPGASTALQTALASIKLGKSWEEPAAIDCESGLLTDWQHYSQLKVRTTQVNMSRLKPWKLVIFPSSAILRTSTSLCTDISAGFADPIKSQPSFKGTSGTCTKYFLSCATRVKSEP